MRAKYPPMVRGRKNPLFFGLPYRLKKARRQSCLKRLPLAEKAGLATATGRDTETGQRIPTVNTVARLASALGVSAGWLGYGLGEQFTDGKAATTDGMGARLASVRTERGLTKVALARLLDLSATAIANIEKGAQTGVDVLESLAKALNVSPAWLAFCEGPREILVKRRSRLVTGHSVPSDR